jgi:hypothetical protein
MNRQRNLLNVVTSVLLLLFISAFGIAPSVAQEGKGMLDNKVFVGPTGKKGEDAGEQDEIRFEDGRFRSVDCEQWGFEEAPYTTEAEGDAIRFHAVALSPKHGKIEWDGVVQGDTVEATYVWTKERWYWKDAHQEKWFKGTLQ